MRTGLAGSEISIRMPWPSQAPPASPSAGYTVMSWHCREGEIGLTPGTSFAPAGPAPNIFAIMPSSAPRRAELSAELGVPVPPRDFMMLSSCGLRNPEPMTISRPSGSVATKPPLARASAASFFICAMSSGASACEPVAFRPAKMFARLTIAACSGCASGTLMISMRISDEFGFWSGASLMHPASSPSGRIPEEPDT